MAHIVKQLSFRQLEARYRASHDATEARHLRAIWLLAQGRTFLEVAEVLAFVPRWVEQLAATSTCGRGAICRNRSAGPPPQRARTRPDGRFDLPKVLRCGPRACLGARGVRPRPETTAARHVLGRWAGMVS